MIDSFSKEEKKALSKVPVGFLKFFKKEKK